MWRHAPRADMRQPFPICTDMPLVAEIFFVSVYCEKPSLPSEPDSMRVHVVYSPREQIRSL